MKEKTNVPKETGKPRSSLRETNQGTRSKLVYSRLEVHSKDWGRGGPAKEQVRARVSLIPRKMSLAGQDLVPALVEDGLSDSQWFTFNGNSQSPVQALSPKSHF